MAKKERKIRLAPNSKESEMMVLGSMLTSVGSLNIAADLLEDSDFYYTEHQVIFAGLKSLYQMDKPADVHILSEVLKGKGKLDEIGGISYLTLLAQYAGTSAYIEEYAKIVKEKSLLRKMIDTSQSIERKAFEEKEEPSFLLDEAQAQFFQISQSASTDNALLLSDILSGAKAESKLPFLKTLEERQQTYLEKGPDATKVTGMPSHFIDLDKMLNGLGKSNLIILAARPAMGKTALALNFAENACFKNNVPVGIFSLEMSAEQIMHRMICSQAEVDSEKILTGSLNGIEYQRVVGAVNKMQKHTLLIDDQPGLKITDLRARARRMKETHNIGFLIIDYLQLLSGSGTNRSQESRQMEVSEISRLLKTLARELDIPILVAAQLSRKVEERQGHRPMMSDLRESGCVSGDTLIKDAETNQLYTIQELTERAEQTPIMVWGIDRNHKLVKAKMTKAFYSGKKMVYLLKTRTGRSIKASANHPFKKLEGWTRLDQLKIKDKIALPRKNYTPSKSSQISKEEIILIAHLLGDGCILKNQPYHYTSCDLKNIEVVEKCAKNLFGITPKRVKQKNWYHVYFPSPIHTTHNCYHPITNWFKKLNILRARSYEKKIPEKIFQSSRKDIALFLNHLWATDGNISKKQIKGRKPSASIYYASSSKILSEQVQHLLLSLGIQSTITSTKKKNYRNMYNVYIQNSSNKRKFLKEVGCYGERGNNIAELLDDLDKVKENVNLDVIPIETWKSHIEPAKIQAKLSWRTLSKKLNTAYCGSTLMKSSPSRNRMKKLAEITNSLELSNLASSDVYWDEIVSIDPLEEIDVYDATVEEIHNFVANDIIIHNSLEQDSDVIVFLLRKDYYDPYDKPGMAELIVGKNRHGATGTVNLVFRKEIGQFKNYTPVKEGDVMENDEAFEAFSPRE